MLRRTKIVATLGPATDTPESLAAINKAGVDVTRLNFSHGYPVAFLLLFLHCSVPIHPQHFVRNQMHGAPPVLALTNSGTPPPPASAIIRRSAGPR